MPAFNVSGAVFTGASWVLWACLGYGVTCTSFIVDSFLPPWLGWWVGVLYCGGGACFASLPPSSLSFISLFCLVFLDDDGLVLPWGSHGLAATLAPVLPCGYGAVKYCASTVVYKGAIIVELSCCVECGFLGPSLPLCVRVCMS